MTASSGRVPKAASIRLGSVEGAPSAIIAACLRVTLGFETGVGFLAGAGFLAAGAGFLVGTAGVLATVAIGRGAAASNVLGPEAAGRSRDSSRSEDCDPSESLPDVEIPYKEE